MKKIGKIINEKGIVLIALVAIILILVGIISVIIKSIFDLQSIGATEIEKEEENCVGKYVAYIPEEGTYSNVSKEYAGTKTNSFEFTTDKTLEWRIWNINDNKLTLIADRPATVGGYKNVGGLYLANCNGYNNGVRLLNEICNKCYSSAKYNAVARSLNVDDIEDVLDKTKWIPQDYSKKSCNYAERKEYMTNACYPYIYLIESGANIDDAEIEIEKGIQRSEQSTMCNASYTYKKATIALKPMQTAWSNSNLQYSNFIKNEYYDLIFKDGSQKNLMSYFLASRAVDLEENYVNFGIFEVSMGKNIKTNPLFNSRGASIEYWDRIRPVVEIDLKDISLNKLTDGNTPETAWRLENK